MVTTIVLLVSREFFLQRIFANLDLLECDPAMTNLLVISDGDYTLFERSRNFTVNSRFKERLCIYRKKGLPNVGSVRSRRTRIADIHNEAKELIQECDYILLLEDDTIISPNTLKALLSDYSYAPHAGFISGVELGRWGYTHIGAWKVDDIYNTKQITSVLDGNGLEEVDAAGFFCCLVKKDNYIKHNFQPFENILGPDVNFGLELRKVGLKNYIDYTVKCKHITKRGDISFHNSDIMQVQFTKENEKWSMKQL